MDHSSKSYHSKTKTNKRPDMISLGLVTASSMRDRPMHYGQAQLWEPGRGTLALVNKAAVQRSWPAGIQLQYEDSGRQVDDGRVEHGTLAGDVGPRRWFWSPASSGIGESWVLKRGR